MTQFKNKTGTDVLLNIGGGLRIIKVEETIDLNTNAPVPPLTLVSVHGEKDVYGESRPVKPKPKKAPARKKGSRKAKVVQESPPPETSPEV